MSREQHKSLPKNEHGFASIVIALVLIIVLALLTVGFAQLARREQQDALDKQLASQAYDAAESGVNSAYADITHSPPYITTGTPGEGGASCISGTNLPPAAKTYKYDSTNEIDSNHGVSYSCLLVDLNPPNLSKDLSAGTAWNTVFKVVGSDGSDRALQSFDIKWSSKHSDHTGLPPAGTQFPPIGTGSGQWGSSPALLEVSITPLGAVDRNSLIDNNLTAYLRPSSTAGSLTYPATAIQTPTDPYSGDVNGSGAGGQGQIIQAKCTNGNCSVTVNMTGGAGAIGGQNGEQYLIHILDYYDDSSVTLANARDSGGTQAFFGGSQAVIDVTGKARQVLKRIQVHVPLKPEISLPSYGIEAQDLCKRLQTTVDTLPDGSPGGTNVDTSGITDPNKACDLP